MTQNLDAPNQLLDSRIVRDGKDLLDQGMALLLDGCVHQGMEHIIHGLYQIRLQSSKEGWQRWAATTCLQHSLTAILHECPFTFHSFSRPRGYPGDAALLDFIYGITQPSEAVSPIGRDIFSYCVATPMPSAVRERKSIICGLVDGQSRQSALPIRVLSLACGHCREAQDSLALREGRISQWIAFDQDRESLRLVQEAYGQYPIVPQQGSIHSLGRHIRAMPDLDVIYACGLYDYLADKVAKRLTTLLFSKLRPGGRLFVGNFLPEQSEIGYMETFMRWHLIYRSLQQIEGFASEIPPAERGLRIQADHHEAIGYLELTRLSSS